MCWTRVSPCVHLGEVSEKYFPLTSHHTERSLFMCMCAYGVRGICEQDFVCFLCLDHGGKESRSVFWGKHESD